MRGSAPTYAASLASITSSLTVLARRTGVAWLAVSVLLVGISLFSGSLWNASFSEFNPQFINPAEFKASTILDAQRLALMILELVLVAFWPAADLAVVLAFHGSMWLLSDLFFRFTMVALNLDNSLEINGNLPLSRPAFFGLVSSEAVLQMVVSLLLFSICKLATAAHDISAVFKLSSYSQSVDEPLAFSDTSETTLVNPEKDIKQHFSERGTSTPTPAPDLVTTTLIMTQESVSTQTSLLAHSQGMSLLTQDSVSDQQPAITPMKSHTRKFKTLTGVAPSLSSVFKSQSANLLFDSPSPLKKDPPVEDDLLDEKSAEVGLRYNSFCNNISTEISNTTSALHAILDALHSKLELAPSTMEKDHSICGLSLNQFSVLEGLKIGVFNLEHIARQLRTISRWIKAINSPDAIPNDPNVPNLFSLSSLNRLHDLSPLHEGAKLTPSGTALQDLFERSSNGVFDPSDMIESVAEAMVNAAEIRGLELIVNTPIEFGKEGRFFVCGEENCMRQVLMMVCVFSSFSRIPLSLVVLILAFPSCLAVSSKWLTLDLEFNSTFIQRPLGPYLTPNPRWLPRMHPLRKNPAFSHLLFSKASFALPLQTMRSF